MEHFYERPLAFRRLTGDQHQVTRIDGVMKNPIERGCAQGAHDLRGNAQDRAHRHRAMLVHPFVRQRPLEIFRYIDKAIVLDSDPQEEFEEMLLKAAAPLRAWRPADPV